MSEDDAYTSALAPGDRGNRTHSRVRVRVRARTRGDGAAARNVEIRDVGMGGMFVVARVRKSELRTPHTGLVAVDGYVHLDFQVPFDGPALTVSGRPLRITEHGFGLAFDDRFQDEAAVLIEAVGGTRTYDSAEPSRVSANLMADIEDVVSSWLPSRLAVFFEKSEHRLVKRADIALSNAEQAPFFDAIAELKLRVSDLEAAFTDLLQERLVRLGAPFVIAEEESVTQAMELSLVDKDQYEIYLSIADMTTKAEVRYDLLLYRLGCFLSTLATSPIDNANNPLAPSALCDPFHECMHDAPINGEALGLIYQSFEDGVVKDLKPLYESLISLFERSGVDFKPEPPPTVPTPPRQGTHGDTGPGRQAYPATPDVGPPPAPMPLVPDPHSAEAPPADSPANFNDARPPSSEDLLVPDVKALGAPVPRGGSPSIVQIARAAPPYFSPRVVEPPERYAMPAPQPGSAFGAVHALLCLRGGGQPTPAVRADAPSSEAVLGMLAEVQAQQIAAGAGSFRTGVREALGVGADFNDASSLGEVGDAVALVGALCDAMREDSEVTAQLATRLQNLEPAIHKVVVLDPGFFEQSGHPSRQVLNQMARLVPELTPLPDTETSGDDLPEWFWSEVDALLEPLIKGFGRDLSLFDAVLAELDLVLEQQHQNYAANLQAVIDACEAQAEFIRKRRQQSGGSVRTPSDAERDVSREWSVWLRRAGRLEPGEAIEFYRGENVERCRVAWMDEMQASFVLVNALGEKTHTLSRQELAMQLRRGGAAIVRDHDLPLVDRALSRVLQEVHSSVERQATYDLDSGLLNRRAFGARLRKALDQSPEEGDGVAVICVVLDEYEDIAERYGVEPARVLLQRVSRRVSSVTGDEDALGNLSPGNVIGFVPDMTAEEASASADQICANINRMKVRWGEKPLKITVRAGVVLAPPGDDVTDVLDAVERVIVDSTAATGKMPGVNADVRVEAGKASMMDYVSLINNTLGKDQMQLRCQRVQPLETGRRARPYFEVLLGVRDENREAVAAGDFIRAAQHYEQMPALDRWVMRSTFRWMADHRRWLRHLAGFSVNLSASALQGENLTEYVLELLSETGVPPGKVIFEITEAAVVQDTGLTQNFLRTLSEVGCQFALDDFGGRDGTYGYLKQLPVAYVKLDGQFTRELATDEANLAVVQSLCEVAHFMGKKTVAEQVETVASLNALAGIGVNFVQGYCIEKPCYLEALEESSLKKTPHVVTTVIESLAADAQSGIATPGDQTLPF